MPFNLNFTKRQWSTLFIIGLADFCNAICVSLQAPFFPFEAEKKGATATEYGFVFGVFELVVFIVSPIYGQYMNRIGPKVLFNAGIFTTGTSSILFGLLDRCPTHMSFITFAFLIRIVEALGNAAFLTASFAIIAKEFPENVATTFASLETFFGLGLIVGPMVGGLLYAVDGYYLPFVVLGSALFLTATLTLFVLPRHPDEDENNSLSMMTILKIPTVLMCSVAICATSCSIGFLGATLEPHLREFGLNPIILGMVFVINGGVYAVTAPIWGCMCDRFLDPKVSACIGSVLVAIGFCFVGPVSFVPLETSLKTAIVGLVFHGFGIAAILVSTFIEALRATRGMGNRNETYGLISGLWTSTFALGAFIGPSVSGYLFDKIGFRASSIFIILIHVAVAILFFSYILVQRKRIQFKEIPMNEPLLKTNEHKYYNSYSHNGYHTLNNNNNNNKINKNVVAAVHSSDSNLIVCKSYDKQSQWSSRLHHNNNNNNTPLGCGFRQIYGSVDNIRPGYHDAIA